MSQLVNFKNAAWTLEERYAIKFCFKLGENAMRWKLDLLRWPRDQETEFPVEACWLSQTQEGQAEQIHPQTFDDSFFWQHWHDLHALGSHWTDSQQGMLCWGLKTVQEEIPSKEASTLQIGLWHFHQDNSILVKDYLTKKGIKTLVSVTFGYSLSSEAVIMRQLRGWKRLWRRSLTRSHKRTSMGPSRNCWNGSCVYPNKVLMQKSLETYLMILVPPLSIRYGIAISIFKQILNCLWKVPDYLIPRWFKFFDDVRGWIVE